MRKTRRQVKVSQKIQQGTGNLQRAFIHSLNQHIFLHPALERERYVRHGPFPFKSSPSGIWDKPHTNAKGPGTMLRAKAGTIGYSYL